MAVEYRACRMAEAKAVLDLWQRSGATVSVTDTIEDLRALVAVAPRSLIVAVDGDTVIGSIIACFDGWRGNLYRLAVDPAYRRQGVGRALVEGAEHTLAAQGVKRITALVESDHPDAMGFWRGIDWELRHDMVRYYRDMPKDDDR